MLVLLAAPAFATRMSFQDVVRESLAHGAAASVAEADRDLARAEATGGAAFPNPSANLPLPNLDQVMSRPENTILMISRYQHLMEHEREAFGRAMVIRGSLERLVPVAMTALCAGIALVPLALAGGQPGKEILTPVAQVILGGMVSSTLLDMIVTPTMFLRFSHGLREAK